MTLGNESVLDPEPTLSMPVILENFPGLAGLELENTPTARTVRLRGVGYGRRKRLRRIALQIPSV
jgi:hypothetical protein